MNTILTLIILLAFVAALSVAIPAPQAVLAKGPPAKAQAILSADSKDRGAVASEGQGGGTCYSCG